MMPTTAPSHQMSKNYAAGILPISWVGDTALFLIGKDIRDGTYSDFGGKRERYDRNELATASREFYEETLGTVVGQRHVLMRLTPKSAVLINGRTQNGNPYYMYVLEVPYSPYARAAFKKTADFLRSKNVNRLYVEKLDIQWATLEMLKSMHKRSVFENTMNANIKLLEAIGEATPSVWRALCAAHAHNFTTSM